LSESQPNPLSEASPDSLSELFARNPLQLSDQDIGKIVSELRRQREKWQVDEGKPKAKKASKAVKLDVSLDDLGI
jgi:hypothetical protein